MQKKIIYIAFVDSKHIGVMQKISSQIEIWKSLNFKINLVTDITTTSTIKKYAARYLVLFRYFVLMKNSDCFIYLRQTPQLPLYASMLSRRNFSCEVNADIKSESINYSIIKKVFAFFLPQQIHNIASSTFYVSLELKKRMDLSKRSAYVFPNSLRALPSEHVLPRSNNVVFVGTPEYQWQGFDLFLSICQAMPKYKFHVIGSDSGPSHFNLKYHGELIENEYRKVMGTMDFAIGTLAFHRAGITEGSPLKVRDYLAYNLPFVIGYNDSDFSSSKFCLTINPNIIADEIGKIQHFFDLWKLQSIKISKSSPFLHTNREAQRVSLICSK